MTAGSSAVRSALGLPADRPARILGLFAHPDDEVFCLGGTMAELTDDGADGRIVSLTRGEAGQIRDASVATRRTLGAVREGELARAGAVLGVREARCLDLADGTLADQPLARLAAAAGAEIDRFRPDVVVSFGPDGGYGHPDHVTVSSVAVEAAAASEARPVVLHAVFPRRDRLLLALLVDWLSGLDDRFRGTQSFANGLMLFANGSSMLGYAADHLDVRFYPAGTLVIEQGEPPDELFLVLSGTVDVVAEDEAGRAEKLATAGPGSFVGEDGIAGGRPRNANVVAADAVTCFVLSPGQATSFAGRGTGSTAARFRSGAGADDLPPGCITVDVRHQAARKATALACHRSQYAIDDGMFPPAIVEELFGTEHFVVAGQPDASSAG